MICYIRYDMYEFVDVRHDTFQTLIRTICYKLERGMYDMLRIRFFFVANVS
jgi:hypothetical protein